MKKIIKVGGYARVSHEEQKKFGFSIDTQVDKIKKYCELKDYQLVDIYIDEGFSASNMKRPSLLDLLNDLKKFDAIVFTRLDRFSRNVLEANKMLATLEKNNVSMIAIEEEDINTTDADGLFMFQLKVSLAEREIKKTSERIRSVFEYKIKEGQVISGQVSLGYKIETIDGVKRLVKNKDEEDLVLEIFNYFLKHQSIRLTMSYINNKYDTKRSYQVFSRMLRNEIYTGKHYNNNNFTEPYISRETYDKIQNIIDKNIRTGKKRFTFIFSGLITCPVCSNTLVGTKQYYKGNYTYYYRCNKRYIQSQCSHDKYLSEKKIEEYIVKNIDNLVSDHIASVTAVKVTNIDVDKKINALKNELENLNYIFMKKRISIADYDKLYEETENKLKELEKMPNKKVDTAHLTAFLSSGWINVYESMNRENKRALWRSLIKEIHIDRELNIKIIFY